MRICVVGAGAIGGLMGAKLALSGQALTLIDQGAHLAQASTNGGGGEVDGHCDHEQGEDRGQDAVVVEAGGLLVEAVPEAAAPTTPTITVSRMATSQR